MSSSSPTASHFSILIQLCFRRLHNDIGSWTKSINYFCRICATNWCGSIKKLTSPNRSFSPNQQNPDHHELPSVHQIRLRRHKVIELRTCIFTATFVYTDHSERKEIRSLSENCRAHSSFDAIEIESNFQPHNDTEPFCLFCRFRNDTGRANS